MTVLPGVDTLGVMWQNHRQSRHDATEEEGEVTQKERIKTMSLCDYLRERESREGGGKGGREGGREREKGGREGG